MAHLGAARHVPAGDAPGRGTEREAVLGVDAAFDRGAVHHDVALAQRETFACGDADLLGDDVDARDEFGHRVLDLHAGVHLDEVELAVFIEEFERAGAAVADAAAGLDAPVPELFDELARDAGRGRLLEHLLVAALHRAVALAEIDGVLEVVREDLDFDVAGIFEELLEIDLVGAESGLRFGLRPVDRVDQRLASERTRAWRPQPRSCC